MPLPMRIKEVNERVKKQARDYGVYQKLQKQLLLFAQNHRHPGLHTEKLEPKSVGLYSFRIDKQLRAIFRIRDGEAEILKISKHHER